jgi:hypothetical protein
MTLVIGGSGCGINRTQPGVLPRQHGTREPCRPFIHDDSGTTRLKWNEATIIQNKTTGISWRECPHQFTIFGIHAAGISII